MLPALKEIIEIVLQQNAFSILRAVPLNNDAVQRHIDEMSSDVLKQLVEILSISKHSRPYPIHTLMQWENFMKKRRYQCKIYCNVQQTALRQWLESIEDSSH